MSKISKSAMEYLTDLEITLSDGSVGYSSPPLTGYKAILGFFKDEAKFWDFDAPGFQLTINRWKIELQRIIASIESLPADIQIDRAQADQKWKTFRSQLQQLQQYNLNQIWPYFFSKTTEAVFIRDLSSEGQDVIFGAIRYIRSETMQHILGHPLQIRGYLSAFLFNADKGGKYSRLKSEIERLKRLATAWEKKKQDLEKEFDDFTGSQSDWQKRFQEENQEWNADRQEKFHNALASAEERAEKQHSAAQDDLSNIKAAYEELLTLQAPAKYWKLRGEGYHKIGKMWMKWLIGSIIFVVGSITLFLYLPPEFLNNDSTGKVITPKSVKSFLLLVTMISLAVYAIRVFAKMTFSSFHLQRDAEERRQLTLVYLALIKGDAASKEDRGIILSSLFSRADIGILGGDSAPKMPTSFIDRFIGGGNN